MPDREPAPITEWTPRPGMLDTPEKFTNPLRGHRVVGNLYAVGTHDLGVFLVTTDAGHILINTGVQGSEGPIRANIESLGFHLEDVKILLSMQSHWDHTAALATIKRLTGAELRTTSRDVRVLEDGGYSDPHFGGGEMFEPVSVDMRIDDGDTVELGGVVLRVHEHPGHTEGSSSYSMRVDHDGTERSVLIANMPTINKGKRLVVDPTYPGVGDDFAKTFEKLKALEPDVWVAAHGGHYGLHDKYVPGQAYDPDAFADPEGFRAAVARLEARYREALAAEHR